MGMGGMPGGWRAVVRGWCVGLVALWTSATLAAAPGGGAAGAPVPATAGTPYTIAVLGDSLASSIGDTLINQFRNDPRIRILRKAKPATGFSRYDVFNWQDQLKEITASNKLDAAIVLMGTNDRQAIHLDNFRAAPFASDEWRKIYSERFDAFARHLSERGVWVIWVGLPVMQNKAFDKGMRTIDAIYQQRSARHCFTYVSLYEKTADGNGEFMASGLDAQGRRKVLRANDGIHFTTAGYEVITRVVLDAMRQDVVACEPAP